MEEKKFILKHKNINVIEIWLDYKFEINRCSVPIRIDHMPVGSVKNGKVDLIGLNTWWLSRTIPASRENIEELLAVENMHFPQQLLEKSFGLSLTDQYWVMPFNVNLDWHKINFFENAFSEDVGDVLTGIKPIDLNDSLDLLSPDNTSDGMLKKKWKIINGKRYLLKSGTGIFKQEIANEILASTICSLLNIKHVTYEMVSNENEKYSICENFISADTELVPGARIKKCISKRNDESYYTAYINECIKYGIKDAELKMNQMLVLDYIIANTDRHWNNFGVIRNADTLCYIDIAPIYDSGTSMWVNESEKTINPKDKVKSKPFRKFHDEQIKLVKDFSWLDLSKLDGIEDEYMKILNKVIDDESQNVRNKKLCNALRQRVDMLKEMLQRGVDKRSTISD